MALNLLAQYHPVVIEGMGSYDKREPGAVADHIVQRLHEHWARHPITAARGPIIVTQGDPLAERGISAITRAVAASLSAPRALVCLDEAVDATHARDADRHGVVVELRLPELEPCLAPGFASTHANPSADVGMSANTEGRNETGGGAVDSLASSIDDALRAKNAARAAEGKPPLKRYFRDYAMLQEMTKAAVRRLCGGITVAHTYADINPNSVTSFFHVGVSLGLISPADIVHFDARQ